MAALWLKVLEVHYFPPCGKALIAVVFSPSKPSWIRSSDLTPGLTSGHSFPPKQKNIIRCLDIGSFHVIAERVHFQTSRRKSSEASVLYSPDSCFCSCLSVSMKSFILGTYVLNMRRIVQRLQNQAERVPRWHRTASQNRK